MPRIFNTAGPCLPGKHYMLPPSRRLPEVEDLVAGEFYFVLHAPRQTGKTTLLRSLSASLTAEGRHAALTISLESFTSDDVTAVMPQILQEIALVARSQLPPESSVADPTPFLTAPHIALKSYLAAWSASIDRPLVIFFDEIDALCPDVLLSVLRQLRSGYTARPAPFPASVALVGLRDVRDYRVRVRDESTSLGTSSPFNIKVRSMTLDNFDEAEVSELLEQHTADTGQRFEDEAKGEIFGQTQGQPWLVNALAAQLVTDFDALVKDRSTPVTRERVLEAREILIERRDTHLDSLVARLMEDRVRRVIEPIMTGEICVDPTYDDDFSYVRDLGLVTVTGGARRIANPIYQEIIPRVLTHQVQTSISDDPRWYLTDEGTLDMGRLLEGFLNFWRRHGEVLLRGMPYHEAAPHLVLMAYLQRIVNSGGRIEREFAVGTGAADLWVTYGGREDVIELKIQRGRFTLEDGLAQVARYTKRIGRDTGYLVIFDPKSEVPWDDRGQVETLTAEGVRVVVVRA
ncbi:MAG: ATP-binding protein [Candidatus Riflebacteria bacterium]|nr:ATP-binding protein [Candidatus Riflebacteria bacterium]